MTGKNQKKAWILLLLMLLSLTPLKLFCHQRSVQAGTNPEFQKDQGHHDCPFCSGHFINELEGNFRCDIPVHSAGFPLLSYSPVSGICSISLTTPNKSPPTPRNPQDIS